MFCKKCGEPFEPDERFCGACGEPLTDQPAFQPGPVPTPPPVTPVWPTQQSQQQFQQQQQQQFQPQPIYPAQPSSTSSSNASMLNMITLLIVGVCIVLWLVAPFVTLSARYTFLGVVEEQSSESRTALKIVEEYEASADVEKYAFWASIASAAGIVLCGCLVFGKKASALRAVAVLTDITLAVLFYFIVMEFKKLEDAVGGYYQIDLIKVPGIGCLGICVLLLVACVTCRNATPKPQVFSTY